MKVSSLLGRLLLVMGALFAVLAGIFLFVQRGIILPSYDELEKREATANVNRVTNAVAAELEHLDRTTRDWANWDDLYLYASDRNPAFAASNLQDNIFEINQINLMAIIAPSGQFIWAKAFDPRNEEPLAIKEFQSSGLPANSPLRAGARPATPLAEQKIQGVFPTSAGPLLCVVRPILTSNRQGPARGLLLLGRLLSPEMSENFARQTQTRAEVLPIGPGSSPAGSGLPSLPAAGEINYQITADEITGYTTVTGLDGAPALLVKVPLARTTLNKGKETMRYAFALFGTGVLVCMLAATLLLQRTVTGPVRRLTEAVLATRDSDHHSGNFSEFPTNSEVGTLSREFAQLIHSLNEKNVHLADLNRHLREEAEKLRAAEARLTQLDQLKNEFISVAAHELRTPISSVMGYTEMLSDPASFGPFSAEQQREFLQEIYESSERLTRIIDSILDTSLIESGQPLPLFPENVELATLLKRLITRFQLQTQKHQIVLDLPPSLPSLLLDPLRITQVLENLLSNAIKYSPKGGLITVHVDNTEQLCRIGVTDSGIGMTEEQVARVFDKFYRADGSNTAVRGLGLGMSIARQIIIEHGGDIRVESKPGQGTQVLVTLPLTAATT